MPREWSTVGNKILITSASLLRTRDTCQTFFIFFDIFVNGSVWSILGNSWVTSKAITQLSFCQWCQLACAMTRVKCGFLVSYSVKNLVKKDNGNRMNFLKVIKLSRRLHQKIRKGYSIPEPWVDKNHDTIWSASYNLTSSEIYLCSCTRKTI